jgi:hypothetical protein
MQVLVVFYSMFALPSPLSVHHILQSYSAPSIGVDAKPGDDAPYQRRDGLQGQ